MFARLVKSENDIVGHIAYSLYKKHKAEFISSSGGNPTDEELIAFKKSCQTESAIELYRTKAIEILMEFSESMIREHAKEIEDNITQNHISVLKDVVEDLKPKETPRWKTYLHAIGQSVVSSIVIAIGYAILVFYFENQGKRLQVHIDTRNTSEQVNTAKQDSIAPKTTTHLDTSSPRP